LMMSSGMYVLRFLAPARRISWMYCFLSLS